ncbi:MAG TPA: glycosyltransferase family 39 protein [Vicinamibacterales bacterium]|nr:glycosyltransferase family 39 protein [Vicinamibacterales bacterium]
MRRSLLILLALGGLTFLWGLGHSAIQDSDEAFYAEAAREMVGSGDWVVPHDNFEERLQKPILYYWLTAATYAVAGVSEAAARFWAGAAGLGLALIAWAAARRWYDELTGLIAGAIVATSFGFVPIARQALPDVPFAFFVSVTIWAAIEASLAPPRASGRWLYVASAAAGLAMLTKGPLAVVLPGAVLLPLLIWERRRGDGGGATFAAAIRPAQFAIAAAIFLAVAVPWFAAITERLGAGYLTRFFFEENLERFGTSRYNERRSVFFYFPIIAGGLLPWSVFGALWLRPLIRWVGRARAMLPAERRLTCWALGPLAVFMTSVGSQPRYILPCLVPLAVLLARAISTHVQARARTFSLTALAAGAVMVLLGALVWRARPLLVAANPSWTHIEPALMIAAGAAAIIAAWIMPPRRALAALTVCAAVTVIAFESSVRVLGRPEPVEVVAAAARQAGPVPAICACGAFARSLTFYTHVPTVVGATEDEVVDFLSKSDRVLAAIDSKMLAQVETRMGKSFPRLTEVTYLDSAAWQRVDSLRSPDPKRLQRVILISNR